MASKEPHSEDDDPESLSEDDDSESLPVRADDEKGLLFWIDVQGVSIIHDIVI